MPPRCPGHSPAVVSLRWKWVMWTKRRAVWQSRQAGEQGPVTHARWLRRTALTSVAEWQVSSGPRVTVRTGVTPRLAACGITGTPGGWDMGSSLPQVVQNAACSSMRYGYTVSPSGFSVESFLFHCLLAKNIVRPFRRINTNNYTPCRKTQLK